jgi:hypothetical protein
MVMISTARPQAQPAFVYDYKRIVSAYVIEVVIVCASIWGQWLFARTYGHGNSDLMQQMLLAQIAYAVFEISRVPLAISFRTHASRLVRALAITGVILASFVTVKSMSQLGQIMFQPRLYDVVHSKEDLDRITAARALTVQKIADADAVVSNRRDELKQAQLSVDADVAELAKLPKSQCGQISGTDKNGNAYQGHVCKDDPRVASLTEHLKAGRAERDAAQTRLEQAVAGRKQLDRTADDTAVATAQKDYREALLNSQLHSFAGMVFGIGPTEVTDAQINMFLRIFVFVPAICIAFASSLLAITAVRRVEPELIPFHPEGTEYLLNPLYRNVLNDALASVEAKHKADAATVGASA